VRGSRVLITALLVFASTTAALCKDLALITHKSNATSSLAIPELAKICKGQTNRWPDGKPVVFVMRDPGSAEMRIVLEKVYSMSKSEVMTAISTANHGRMNHPAIMVVDSDDALLHHVEATPGAVGLVDVYAITGGVHVVKIGGKLPLEAGYPLHGN
jgi:ABC-type phosphate transport system substrate-binding protein